MFATEYLIAWAVYVLSGAECCFIWWKITSHVKHMAWRDLGRGFALVIIFTPWYSAEEPELLAPATVVLMMDLLLEGAKSGLKGGIVLLATTFAMLLVLTIRALWLRPKGAGKN